MLGREKREAEALWLLLVLALAGPEESVGA